MVAAAAGRTVCVIGATGAQGGSVVRSLLASTTPYHIYAVSRDPTKPNAQKLAEQGCTVVKADTGNAQDLARIFKGMDVIFAVTDFWAHRSAEREFQDGKRIIDEAQSANCKLFVWSGLEPVAKTSQGRLTHVSHFDSKAAVTDYAKSVGIPLVVTEPGCYMTNFIGGGMGPHFTEDGSGALEMALPVRPETKVALMDPNDFGVFVLEAIESPQFGAGAEVLACAEEISLEDMAKQWGEVTGKPVTYRQLPVENFSHGGESALEMLQMVQWWESYGYFGGKDVKPSQSDLAAPVAKWKDFVAKTDWSHLGC